MSHPAHEADPRFTGAGRGRRDRARWRALLVLAGATWLASWTSCRLRDRPDGAPGASASASAATPAAPLDAESGEAGEDDAASGSRNRIELGDAEAPAKGTEALAFVAPDPPERGEESLRTALVITLSLVAEGEDAAASLAEGMALLDEDPEINSGQGANLRADGQVELEAAIMDSRGRFAAVAGVREVPTPARLAAALLSAPDPVLTGEGATELATRLGLAESISVSQAMQERLAAQRAARANLSGDAGWAAWPFNVYARAAATEAAVDGGDAAASGGPSLTDAAALPHAPLPVAALDAAVAPADAAPDAAAELAPGISEAVTPPPPTPGAPPLEPQPQSAAPATAECAALLLRTPDSEFVAVLSSGGPAFALPGYVGHVSVLGAGLYVGQRGAVAVSGPAALVRSEQLARRVYQRLAQQRSAKLAASWGLSQLPPEAVITIAVLGERDAHVASNGTVAWQGWRDQSWSGSREVTAP